MITSAQIRAGRGLLRWTQATLASRAAVSAVTLNMIESEQVSPRAGTLSAIRRVLEREGVRFIGDEADGFGVVLRPEPQADATGSAGRRPGRRGAAATGGHDGDDGLPDILPKRNGPPTAANLPEAGRPCRRQG